MKENGKKTTRNATLPKQEAKMNIPVRRSRLSGVA